VVSDRVFSAAGVTVEGGEAHEITVKGREEALKVRAFPEIGPLRSALEPVSA